MITAEQIFENGIAIDGSNYFPYILRTSVEGTMTCYRFESEHCIKYEVIFEKMFDTGLILPF